MKSYKREEDPHCKHLMLQRNAAGFGHSLSSTVCLFVLVDFCVRKYHHLYPVIASAAHLLKCVCTVSTSVNSLPLVRLDKRELKVVGVLRAAQT
jgi:hypothetical protein